MTSTTLTSSHATSNVANLGQQTLVASLTSTTSSESDNDLLESCRESTLHGELDDDDELPELDEDDDENEDDHDEDEDEDEFVEGLVSVQNISRAF